MTTEDIRSELDRKPFLPFRLHLVSGKTVDVWKEHSGWLLRHAVMILQDSSRTTEEHGYNIVALRNVEMLAQLVIDSSKRRTGGRNE